MSRPVVVGLGVPPSFDRGSAKEMAQTSLYNACKFIEKHSGYLPSDARLIRLLNVTPALSMTAEDWNSINFVVAGSNFPRSLHVRADREVVWFTQDQPEGMKIKVGGLQLQADVAVLIKIGGSSTEEWIVDSQRNRCVVIKRDDASKFLKSAFAYTNFSAKFTYKDGQLAVEEGYNGYTEIYNNYEASLKVYDIAQSLRVSEPPPEVDSRHKSRVTFWSPENERIHLSVPQGRRGPYTVVRGRNVGRSVRTPAPTTQSSSTISTYQVDLDTTTDWTLCEANDEEEKFFSDSEDEQKEYSIEHKKSRIFYEAHLTYEQYLSHSVEHNLETRSTYVILGDESAELTRSKNFRSVLQKQDFDFVLLFNAQCNQYPATAQFLAAYAKVPICAMTGVAVRGKKENSYYSLNCFLFGREQESEKLTAFHNSLHQDVNQMKTSLPVGNDEKFFFFVNNDKSIEKHYFALRQWFRSYELRKQTTVVVLETTLPA